MKNLNRPVSTLKRGVRKPAENYSLSCDKLRSENRNCSRPLLSNHCAFFQLSECSKYSTLFGVTEAGGKRYPSRNNQLQKEADR